MEITSTGNVLVIAWHGNATLEVVTRLEEASLQLARGHRAIAHLNVVSQADRPAPMDEAARTRIIALLRDPAHRLAASATVFGDGGFVSAAIRGVLAGLALVAGTRAKVRFLPRLEAATAWLRTCLAEAGAPAPTDAELIAAADLVLRIARTRSTSSS